MIEAELRRMLDPAERLAAFVRWKASLHPGVPRPPATMKEPLYFFSTETGELEDLMDAANSCHPYAGGDYNGHCGGCPTCLAMQAEHSGSQRVVSYRELCQTGTRFRPADLGAEPQREPCPFVAGGLDGHDFHPLHQRCRRCGLSVEQAIDRHYPISARENARIEARNRPL